MAYDRYDTDERSRWRDERSEQRGMERRPERDREDRFMGRDWDREERGRSDRDERGFFERAGDEIASWFGDDDAERRRHRDRMSDDPRGPSRMSERGWDQEPREDQGRFWRDRTWGIDDERGRERRRFGGEVSPRERYDRNQDRAFAGSGSTDRGRRSMFGENLGRDRQRSQRDDYRPMTGDYGRGTREFGDYDQHGDRSSTPWGRDEYRRTSRVGTSDWSDRSRDEMRGSGPNMDPQYHSWRDRHMSELDRDYEDYRREHQSRFEDDFRGWRDQRQQKRSLLGLAREHMEVVGNDDHHVGTVDRVAGDRLILTKSDPESGGAHHSLSCSDIDRIDGNRVILGCSAEQARHRWRDEHRNRALFEREDQGEMGPYILDRSFEGTYR